MESIWIYKNNTVMSLEDSTIRWNEIQDIGVVVSKVRRTFLITITIGCVEWRECLKLMTNKIN
jgi:hypothetical protein